MSLTPRSALDIIWARLSEAIGGKIAAAADSADKAETQAGVATSEADRAKTEADNAASAAAAEVDKLTAGAPEAFDTLKEISDELEKNETERAALATTIGKKADKGHTHASADITDSTDLINDPAHSNKVVKTGEDGFVHGNSPTSTGHVATKGYVDGEVSKKADPAYVDSAVSDKATKSEVGKKADTTYVDQELGKKADSGHTHSIGEIRDADEALGKKADAGHRHTTGQIDNLDVFVDQRARALIVEASSAHFWDGQGTWEAPWWAGPDDRVFNLDTGEVHSVQEVQ